MTRRMPADIRNIQSVLSDEGYIHISDQSSREVDYLLENLGKVIHVTNVKVKPESKSLVTSSDALDFHTDHHKANWILWHCIEQTDIGGESILVDAVAVYDKLDTKNRDILSRIMLFEHKVFDDDESEYPLIQEENGRLRFYYSFWLADKNLSTVQKDALKAFRDAIVNEVPVTIRLDRGDVLIVDNHRMLHGRREIKGHQKRFLKRFWVHEQTNKGGC